MVSGSKMARMASGQEIMMVVSQTKPIFRATIVRDLFLNFRGLEIPRYLSSEMTEMCTMLALHKNTSA
jgi:hypothetical protein